MTQFQKVIKYLAIGLAALLAVSIIGGILGAVGSLGGFVFEDATTEEMKTYTVSSDISRLRVKISAADITIKQGEAFAVESNLKNLTVEDKNGELTVKEKEGRFGNYANASLVLTVPTGTVFEKAEIETGAGRLTADALSAEVLDCDFGAGEIQIDSLFASTKADIDGGAGRITVSDGNINNLDFDMGVGQLNFTAALTGVSDFDLGVGESNLTLIGSKDDYTLDVEKGLGEITVDGYSVSNSTDIDNGQNRVDISGGVGAVNIKFKEK